eukprot:gene25051-10700_t
MLNSRVTFKPAMHVSKGGHVRVTYDIASLTSHNRAQSIALQTRSLKGLSILTDDSDMEELAYALLVQANVVAPDHKTIETHAMARRQTLIKHTYVALLNPEAHMLCQQIISTLIALARPDLDCIVLATVTLGETSVGVVKTVLEEMALPLIESGLKVSISVGVRLPHSRLVEDLEREVEKAGATIYLMGAQNLVNNVEKAGATIYLMGTQNLVNNVDNHVEKAGATIYLMGAQNLVNNVEKAGATIYLMGAQNLVNNVEKAGATIYLMGAQNLVNNVDNYFDSLCLNCLRRLQRPMILVTCTGRNAARKNRSSIQGTGPKSARQRPISLVQPTSQPKASTQAAGVRSLAGTRAAGVRSLVVLEHNSRPLLHFVCRSMDPIKRNDRIPIAQPKAGTRAAGVRSLVVLEHNSRPLLHFVCRSMDPIKRNDRIVLGQKTPPNMSAALAGSLRGHMNIYMDIASQHDIIGAVGTTLKGEVDRVVPPSVSCSANNMDIASQHDIIGAVGTTLEGEVDRVVPRSVSCNANNTDIASQHDIIGAVGTTLEGEVDHVVPPSVSCSANNMDIASQHDIIGAVGTTLEGEVDHVVPPSVSCSANNMDIASQHDIIGAVGTTLEGEVDRVVPPSVSCSANNMDIASQHDIIGAVGTTLEGEVDRVVPPSVSCSANNMDIASQHDIIGAVGTTLEGEVDRVVPPSVQSDNIHLVAISMPKGAHKTILPKPILNLIRVSTVPILIFPEVSRQRASKGIM